MDLDNHIGTSREIAKLLGLTLEGVVRPEMIKENVPSALWDLIPFARYFGISDDILRDRLADAAPAELKSELIELVAKYEDELDDWLGAPEADFEVYSNEYISFSAMRMVSDGYILQSEKK